MINPKLETLNPKQTKINQTQNSKPYDLGDRTLVFSKKVFNYVKQLVKVITNLEVAKQLVRSAGSVGANYLEAEESLSRKDFLMRIKIARKEAKESRYWLVLSEPLKEQEKVREELIDESTQLMKIFGSIVSNSG
ncbi:MAG: four helix bundle protein [Candidatus Omnitrophica bacterium]|nr:four helix bundle protein [Candidatus Omnitrophota bacterium]